MRDTSSPSPPHPGDHLSSRLLEHRIIVLDGELDDRGGTRCAPSCSGCLPRTPQGRHQPLDQLSGRLGPGHAGDPRRRRLIPNDVSTLALGLACSAGQFLMTAGTHGKRYALRDSPILMHQGSAGILRFTVGTVLGLTTRRPTRG